MSRPVIPIFFLLTLPVATLCLTACSAPKPWPDSPLYSLPDNDPAWDAPVDQNAAMAAMAGHYAHYDVVAYSGDTPNGPLSTFVISYGFTDLVIEDGELVEYDRFCHAEYKANQPFTTTFPDAATQAIEPRSAVVNVYQDDGVWKLRRPATPTLIGIDGDPDVPLSMDPNAALVNDDDNDGKPGVTVFVRLYGVIGGEIYIARREIFQNDLTLYSDGSLRGTVTDNSEQLVLGASLCILDTPNNPDQWTDLGLSPIILIPISEDIDTCEELMAARDTLFPRSPHSSFGKACLAITTTRPVFRHPFFVTLCNVYRSCQAPYPRASSMPRSPPGITSLSDSRKNTPLLEKDPARVFANGGNPDHLSRCR